MPMMPKAEFAPKLYGAVKINLLTVSLLFLCWEIQNCEDIHHSLLCIEKSEECLTLDLYTSFK